MKRAVRSLIRLIAAGLMIFGALTLGLEITRHRLKNAEISLWHCILGVILVACGIGLFWVSTPLAERFADDFEE